MLRRFFFNMEEESILMKLLEDLDNFIGNDIFHVENAEDFMMFADSAIKRKYLDNKFWEYSTISHIENHNWVPRRLNIIN